MMCDGSCTTHAENVRTVHVWYGSHDWGLFNYCDHAIQEDESRGMTIEIVTTENQKGPNP